MMLLHDALSLSLLLFRRACAANVAVLLSRYVDGLAEGLITVNFSYYYSYRWHKINSFLPAHSFIFLYYVTKKSIEADGRTTYNGEAPGNFLTKSFSCS